MSDIAGWGGAIRPHAMTVDEVLDRAALQHLVAAYGHAIDRRDYALVATLYHDDAVDDHSPYVRGPAKDYVAWLPQMMATWRATAHVMLSTLFAIDGSRAEGIITARAWHLSADGTREFIAWGRYADSYEKRNGVWRFAHRFFILDATEERDAQAQDSFGTEGVETGRSGADDPVYRRLALFAAERAAQG